MLILNIADVGVITAAAQLRDDFFAMTAQNEDEAVTCKSRCRQD